MHPEPSHSDRTMDTDYRPTRYGSTDYDRKETQSKETHEGHRTSSSYMGLLWMGLIHVPIMYFVMFSMVDTSGDVFHNLNTFYMALMMAAPMVAMMPFMMKDMYRDKKKNILAVAGSLVILIGAYSAIRFQTAIGDTQFIRSMIPHHSGAILMCREARISDPELKTLCENISQAQREEINQMNRILKRLNP